MKRKQLITNIVKIDYDTEPIDEVQNEIVSVEEEVIIEPKPKTKIIIKKKVKKPLVIVEEDNEVFILKRRLCLSHHGAL